MAPCRTLRLDRKRPRPGLIASGRESEFMTNAPGSAEGFEVRRAVPADIPALGRLGALLVSVHHDFDPDRFIEATPDTEGAYAAFLGSKLDHPNAIVLVAEGAGDVLGYCYAGIEGTDYMALRGPAGVIYDLVVHPSRRRSGIGRILLDATIAALEALGAPRILLSTAERNGPAQRLFAAAGFRRTMIEMTREVGKP